METPPAPFQPCGPTVGWQTTTESKAYQLPACQRAYSQVRVFNATAGEALYAYVAFGDETVEANKWTDAPPATCDYIVGPDAEEADLAKAGKLWAACCLFQGGGGIYFTPGKGQAT